MEEAVAADGGAAPGPNGPPSGAVAAPNGPPSGPVSGLLCRSCGEGISAGDRFCEACGHQLETVETAAGPPCPHCGAPDPWVEGWCGQCGARQPDPRDHQETVIDDLVAVTDRGRRHARNEDAVAMGVVAGPGGHTVVVVSDGVSTSQVPHEASQAAVDAALATLLAPEAVAEPDPGPALLRAYAAAREAVLAVPYTAGADLPPPSCTFLAAVVRGSTVHLAAFGDCRAYWVRQGKAEQLTVDDSWATGAIAAGLSPAEAYADARAHAITRWLAADADPAWAPSLTTLVTDAPGLLLACSDGLWNYTLEPSDLLAAMGGTDDLLAAARRLVDHANQAGGSDNITVALVRLPRPEGDRP